MKPLTLIGACLLAAIASTAAAHHSHAMFDDTKRVTIAGTVQDFEFTNPHSWLKVVADSDGTLWSFETNPPSTLARAGIKRSMLPAGIKVTVSAMPLRDGRAGGQIVTVTKADGTVLSMAPQAYNGRPN